ITQRLNEAVNEIIRSPEIQARIIAGGAVPKITTRAEMAAFMAAESARWRPVVQATGLTVD
ncbi:MAG: tripartite tricarboxylate transporter substrate binding protein, partial [Alphaproteobacteria bacterium]|nr:tripartite tricarboxylate transporter substrate binding protein [Alphaproteobacteria bacterium]